MHFELANYSFLMTNNVIEIMLMGAAGVIAFAGVLINFSISKQTKALRKKFEEAHDEDLEVFKKLINQHLKSEINYAAFDNNKESLIKLHNYYIKNLSQSKYSDREAFQRALIQTHFEANLKKELSNVIHNDVSKILIVYFAYFFFLKVLESSERNEEIEMTIRGYKFKNSPSKNEQEVIVFKSDSKSGLYTPAFH